MVERADAHGWTLISPPRAGATPVVVAAFPGDRRPEPWMAELLACLADRLRALEGALATGDLLALVQVFLTRAEARYGKRVQGIGGRALEVLLARRWDGRLHELEHALEGAVLRCPEGSQVEAGHLREPDLAAGAPGAEGPATRPVRPLRAQLEAAERAALREALEHSGGDRRAAARLLDVTLASLERRIARLGLE